MGYYLKLISTALLFFLLNSSALFSQATKALRIINKEYDASIDISSVESKVSGYGYANTDSVITALREVLADNGFLKASIDSISEQDDTLKIYIVSGNEHFFKVYDHNLPKGFLAQRGVAAIPDEKPVSFKYLSQFEKQIIEYFENTGYPMASVNRQNIGFDKDTISFEWQVIKGELYLVEEVRISGDVNMQPGFIRGLTRLQTNMPYSEERIKRAARRFYELEFANLASEPGVIFTPSGARIEFPLERLKANRFDGIAGVTSVPGIDNESDYRISGQLNLYLLNSLGYGEFIDMQWRAPGEGSQQLRLATSFPYILGTPVAAGYDFSMNKQDSTFLLVRHRPEIRFQGYRLFSFSTFAIIETNNVFLSQTAENLSNISLADYRKTLYGLEIKLRSGLTNHTYNAGWLVRTSIATGNRIIDNSTAISGVSDKTVQYVSESTIRHHIPWGRQSMFTYSIIAYLQTGTTFLENELYRIGGFYSLKGFDENSLLGSSYSIITTEYRFYMAQETFFSLLANFAWLENKSPAGYYNNFPLGLAAGLHFRTQPGILSVYYALGKTPKQVFQFRNALIHVGFISVF